MDPRVVDQRAEPAEGRERLGHEALAIRGDGHVEAHGQHRPPQGLDLASHGLQQRCSEIGEDDLHPLVC